MYGVEKGFKMQVLLGLKGSPLVGVRIVNFVPPELLRRGQRDLERLDLEPHDAGGCGGGAREGCADAGGWHSGGELIKKLLFRTYRRFLGYRLGRNTP